MQSSSNLTIDLSIIHNNLKRLIHSFGSVMVMVKANAYGTDALLLCKFLDLIGWNGIPFVGVSHVAEAVHLREFGLKAPLFVISAPVYEAELVAAYNLSCAVSSCEEVERLNTAALKQGKIVPVHLHLNTGMNRFGATKKQALQLCQAVITASNLSLEGVMTHFFAAESPLNDSYTHEQIAEFKSFLDLLPKVPRWIHAANSAGAARFNIPFCNLVRIGLGLIGYGPCIEGIKPALTFTTKLSFISHLNQGEGVGYNRTYINQKKSARVGVIPVGYYDGLHRSLSGKGYVLIRGKQAPMIGTICMDFMMIELTDLPEAEVGDEVILFGADLSAEKLAAWGKTDVRELLVSLPSRIKRVWANPPLLETLTRMNDERFHTERLPSSFFTLEKDPPPR